MPGGSVAAIDLGATSGRVVRGTIEDHRISTEVVARFANRPTRTVDGLHWNVLGIFHDVLDGLAGLTRASGPPLSIAVDSWGVDYGLVGAGRLLGNPFHYRDDRNEAGVTAAHALISKEELYQRNGLQSQDGIGAAGTQGR